ncbi:hypothetical protein CSPX01_12661 [Colletotrichum filicis]|nr:hypothetical protein CSPX01_12661 [Colletotrichum filicis]
MVRETTVSIKRWLQSVEKPCHRATLVLPESPGPISTSVLTLDVQRLEISFRRCHSTQSLLWTTRQALNRINHQSTGTDKDSRPRYHVGRYGSARLVGLRPLIRSLALLQSRAATAWSSPRSLQRLTSTCSFFVSPSLCACGLPVVESLAAVNFCRLVPLGHLGQRNPGNTYGYTELWRGGYRPYKYRTGVHFTLAFLSPLTSRKPTWTADARGSLQEWRPGLVYLVILLLIIANFPGKPPNPPAMSVRLAAGALYSSLTLGIAIGQSPRRVLGRTLGCYTTTDTLAHWRWLTVYEVSACWIASDVRTSNLPTLLILW